MTNIIAAVTRLAHLEADAGEQVFLNENQADRSQVGLMADLIAIGSC